MEERAVLGPTFVSTNKKSINQPTARNQSLTECYMSIHSTIIMSLSDIGVPAIDSW